MYENYLNSNNLKITGDLNVLTNELDLPIDQILWRVKAGTHVITLSNLYQIQKVR